MESAPFLTPHTSSLAIPRARGFTLIEMLVVIAIIITITSVVLVSQNNFNKTLLLTDSTYTVALSVRQAQSLGLSSKKYVTAQNVVTQNAGYGIHFESGTPKAYLQFVDTDSSKISQTGVVNGHWCAVGTVGLPDQKPGDCVYTPNADGILQSYSFNQGYSITNLCAYSNSVLLGCSASSGPIQSIDVLFQRPNTSTTMTAKLTNNNYVPIDLACVQVSSPDGTTSRFVKITQLGEITTVPTCNP